MLCVDVACVLVCVCMSATATPIAAGSNTEALTPFWQVFKCLCTDFVKNDGVTNTPGGVTKLYSLKMGVVTEQIHKLRGFTIPDPHPYV